MANLVKANGMNLMIDEYSIGHAPKDPNFTYINLFVSEANIRSVDIEAMFTGLTQGIEMYEVPSMKPVTIPKFTDDFTMFKEPSGRYVVRLVRETEASRAAKETAASSIDSMEAIVGIYEMNEGGI